MDVRNVKSVFDYIEERYNLLVSLMDISPKDIYTVHMQCFAVVDYFNTVTHDVHYDETGPMWEMWSAKFDALYGR